MWRDQLVAQLDFYWDYSLMPRLDGLTDEEFLWEPVDDCWTVRVAPDGDPTIDWQWPAPEPPPITTIGWRLAHVAIGCFGLRASSHFGDGSLTLETARWPATADEALTALTTHHREWRDGIGSLDDDALLRPVGPAEGPWAEHPMAALVLHINREVMHHGAEVALLRDLYRAGYQA